MFSYEQPLFSKQISPPFWILNSPTHPINLTSVSFKIEELKDIGISGQKNNILHLKKCLQFSISEVFKVLHLSMIPIFDL
jgi:hypothetical protein